MLRTASPVLAVSLLLAACDQASAPSDSSTITAPPIALAATVAHQTQRFSFDAGGFNPCTGEETPGIGQFFSKATLVARSNGGFHVSMAFNISYALTGATTGNRYVGRDVEHVSFSTNGGQQAVQHFIANLRVGTAGPHNDFVLKIRAHVTVNANGVVTVTRDGESVVCR